MEEKKNAPQERGAEETLICEICGTGNGETANFCKICGTKLKDICTCPFLKKTYNCGEQKCPGYGVRRRIKDQADV